MATHLSINGRKISVQKEIENIIGTHIFFVDGSFVNTETGEAWDVHGNIWEIPVGITETPVAEIRQEFEDVFAFKIQNLSTVDTLLIETHDLPTVSVFITGPKDAVDALTLSRQGETISLKGKPHKSVGGIFASGITITSNSNVTSISINSDDNGATAIIKVPVGFELDVENVDAKINIGNTYGKLTLHHSSHHKVKVGDVVDLELVNSGSGKVKLANVTDRLCIRNTSNGKLTMNSAGVQSAEIILTGSGNFVAETLEAHSLALTINSSGSATIDQVIAGVMTFVCKGSGNTSINEVQTQIFKTDLNGSGKLIIALLVAETVTSLQHGSGNCYIRTASVNSEFNALVAANGKLILERLTVPTITIRSSGSGNVEIGGIKTQMLTVNQTSNGKVKLSGAIYGPLKVVTQGSGNFELNGNTDSADLTATSSGKITVTASKNEPKIKKTGSGGVKVLNWK